MENIILTNNKDLRLVGVKVGVLSTLRFELPLVSASATHVEVIVTSGNVHSAYTATFIDATKRWQCDIAASQFPTVGKQSYEIAYVLDGKQFWDGKGWIEIEDATTSGIEPQPRPEPYRYAVVSVNGYGADAQGAVRIPKTFIGTDSPATTEGYMEGDIYFNRETGATWTLCNVQGTLTWVFNYKNYYTKAETDEAIDRVAAYYITYDAAGNPFPTYASLANAQTVYSGGSVRTPTRNDYCVVLADETHQGAEYRYIYAVAEGQTTGSWQPQFPVEGVMTVDQAVTKDSTNPVAGGGVWSAIWGALSALPTGFSSLYDWCVSQLADKLDSTSAAPIFTAKTYAVNDLCTYNGVIYSCKVGYTATASSAKPNADTTHWEAKPASDLFLPLTGGEVSGDLTANGQVNISPFFSITKMLATGLVFIERVNNVERRAILPLSNVFDSSTFAIAFLQNLAPDYNATSAYKLNNLCVHDARLYRCTTAIETAEEWTAAHWTKATVEDVLELIAYQITLKASAATVRNALALKAPLASPAFTGTPTAPTPTAGDDSTNVATTAFVQGAVPYALVTKTITNGAVSLDDRASNSVTVSATLSPNTLTINFPTAPTGKLLDFAMRLNIAAGVTAPEIAWPQGVTLENDGGEVPEIADGGTGGSSTILYFSETENDGTTAKFLVKGETLTAIAQA